MAKVIQTRLRYVCSKNPDIILEYPNKLGYKIEIKGNVMYVKGKFYLWFIIPEDIERESFSGDLDKLGAI